MFAIATVGWSGHRAQYFYDAYSRRIAKRVEEARRTKQQDITKDQPTRTDVTTIFFAWDGDTLMQELGQAETVTYLYEPDSFLPRVKQWDLHAIRHNAGLQAAVVQEQADTETLQASAWQRTQAAADDAAAHDHITHYHCDHLSTPRELTDAQGNVVWSGRYKTWGRLQNRTAAAVSGAI